MNARRDQDAGRDVGFTLIEVIVAILVFAILSTGIVAGMSTIIRMTTDNRARITAANLASQELDTVRAITDIYTIESADWRSIEVGDPANAATYRTYELKRDVSWISQGGSDASCNSAVNLFFLRINVRVRWNGMLGSSPAVQDDTILAPTDGAADSSTGALGISVLGATGQPIPNVTVTVAAASGSTGTTPTVQPKATTNDGCTYANALKPGAYDVSIKRTDFRDDAQQVTSVKRGIQVTAGATNSVTFAFDRAGSALVTHVAGPRTYSGSAASPTSVPLNFVQADSVYTIASAPSVALYPFGSGYGVTAGPLKSGARNCASTNPADWLAGTVDGVPLAAGVTPTVAPAPGATHTVGVAMGVVTVTGTGTSELTATQATPVGAGNPGCGITGTTIKWSVRAGSGTVALLVPYGTWTMKADGTPIGAARLTVETNAALPGVGSNGVVTLDPRAAR